MCFYESLKDLHKLKKYWRFSNTSFFFKLRYSNISLMKKKNSKKNKTNFNKKNQELGQTKNSAKLILFIFGLGPIIGITIFLYSKGFFNSPNM